MYTDHDQFGISDEMMDVTNDDIQIVINELHAFKEDIGTKLKNIKFRYDPIINQDLYESVIEMYGVDYYNANGPYITYTMFMEMLEVTKLASADKAEQLVEIILYDICRKR